MRVALFASGTGSNVQAILDQVDAGKLAIEVVALVCDQPDAKVVERVVGREIPVFVQSVSTLGGREGWEGAVLDFLASCFGSISESHHQYSSLTLAGLSREDS